MVRPLRQGEYSKLSTEPSGSAMQVKRSTTPIRALPAWQSPAAIGVRIKARIHRWDRSATATTTKCVLGSFATFERELIERELFADRSEARIGIFDFIKGGYNPHRQHSTFDCHPHRIRRRAPQTGRHMKAGDCPQKRNNSTIEIARMPQRGRTPATRRSRT